MAGWAEFPAHIGLHPARLQIVFAVEPQHWREGEAVCRDAIGKVALHEGRAGGGDVAQGAKGVAIAACNGAVVAGDGGGDLAAAEPVGGVFLIIDNEIEEEAVYAGECGEEPCCDAVGVNGDADWCVLRRHKRGEVAGEALFQKVHVGGMCGEPTPGIGAGAGLTAMHQKRADPVFERLQTLRDSGLGDAKFGRSTFETASVQDGGESLEVGVVELH